MLASGLSVAQREQGGDGLADRILTRGLGAGLDHRREDHPPAGLVELGRIDASLDTVVALVAVGVAVLELREVARVDLGLSVSEAPASGQVCELLRVERLEQV